MIKRAGRGAKCASVHEEEVEKRHTFELRIISAQDLKKVTRLTRMRTYAEAYVEAGHTARTKVDEKRGENPVWNQVLTLSVSERRLRDTSAATCLTIDVYSAGRLGRDTLVGTARILLSDLVPGLIKAAPAKSPLHVNPIRCLAFWVRRPSGEPRGILNLWAPPSGRFLPPPSASAPASATSAADSDSHHGRWGAGTKRQPAAAAPPRDVSLRQFASFKFLQGIETEKFTFDV